jgi:hypothetical protein
MPEALGADSWERACTGNAMSEAKPQNALTKFEILLILAKRGERKNPASFKWPPRT